MLNGAIEGVLWRLDRIAEDRCWVKENDAVIAAELRRLRQERGITLRTIARHLNVSAVYVSDIERGNRSAFADPDRLMQWVRILSEPTDPTTR